VSSGTPCKPMGDWARLIAGATGKEQAGVFEMVEERPGGDGDRGGIDRTSERWAVGLIRRGRLDVWREGCRQGRAVAGGGVRHAVSRV